LCADFALSAPLCRARIHQHIFDGPYGMMWQRSAILVLLWLACWWMYRRKIFLRI